jgi:hypothetical protein
MGEAAKKCPVPIEYLVNGVTEALERMLLLDRE